MANYGQGASGALSGAATGATLGSIVPGIGTGIGAGVGALAGGLGGLFGGGGNKDKFKQLPNINPGQESFLSQLLQQLTGGSTGQNYQGANDYYSQMLSGDPGAYERFAAPHMTQFNEQVIPRLSERFAGLGGGMGGGVMGSSGFGQAIGGAANQFQSNLAGLYAQLQQHAAGQAFGQYNNLSNLALGVSPFQQLYQPGSTGAFGGAISGLSQGLSSSIGQGIGTGISSKIANSLFPANPAQDTQQQTGSAGKP